MNRQTTHAKNDEVSRNWRHIDATDQILGRLASQVAVILQGKDKPQYTPHHDVGDFVVITNVDKVRITGAKLDQKFHKQYSGHPSGLKLTSYRDMLEQKPELLFHNAVRRMMPKNRLSRQMLKKLKIYTGDVHPHAAQNPQSMELASAH